MIPETGTWALMRCDYSCTQGRFLASWEVIDKGRVNKYNGYGDTPQEAVDALIRDIPECYTSKK